jgi:hypothetical protein
VQLEKDRVHPSAPGAPLHVKRLPGSVRWHAERERLRRLPCASTCVLAETDKVCGHRPRYKLCHAVNGEDGGWKDGQALRWSGSHSVEAGTVFS